MGTLLEKVFFSQKYFSLAHRHVYNHTINVTKFQLVLVVFIKVGRAGLKFIPIQYSFHIDNLKLLFKKLGENISSITGILFLYIFADFGVESLDAFYCKLKRCYLTCIAGGLLKDCPTKKFRGTKGSPE